jgi:hypothetical protein
VVHFAFQISSHPIKALTQTFQKDDLFNLRYKGKAFPVQAWTALWVPGVEASGFQDSRHMKVVR